MLHFRIKNRRVFKPQLKQTMPSFLYEGQPMSPRTKETCEGAKAAQNGLDMEWDGITLGNQISWLDWTSTILAASTLVSAHILLHVPMSSEKWGSSQMLGTNVDKDYSWLQRRNTTVCSSG